MNTYAFQSKLHTLALCVVKIYRGSERIYDSFEFDGMKFTNWHFSFAEGHRPGAWLISGEAEATSLREAHRYFWNKLNDLIPKIALISQCYMEYQNESWLIHRINSDIAYFRYSREASGVPLHFDNDSLEALTSFKSSNISNEFFYYWNDMLNTVGYSAKLLLINSALEALGKALGRLTKPELHQFRREVLGVDLNHKIFADQNRGIRHRLTHGEYFSDSKDREDYLAQIYEKIVQYINESILKKNPIKVVVHPQRHFWGNREGGYYYLKKKPDAVFNFKEMLEACDNSFDDFHARYEKCTKEEIANL